MSPELQEAIDSAKALRDLIGRGLLKKPTPEELDRLQFLAALEATQAELALAKVDAELYRHLRSLNWTDNTLCVVTRPAENVKLGSYCPSGDRLDSELRAAIAASKP